jgi:hypothetical protein
MSNLTQVRRANIRKSIDAHRQGTPAGSPLVSRAFAAWVAGEHRAAKIGKRSHHDLDRGHTRVPAERERQYRCGPPFTPPALPAQQARYQRLAGPGSGLPRLDETEGVKSPFYRRRAA